MNLSFFIARRLYSNKQHDRRVSQLAIQIATIGVTIGLAVMILSVCILLGFKNELTEKIVGFGSHIQILNSKSGASPESFPIVTDRNFVNEIARQEGVTHVQRYSGKIGIVKTDSDFKGILLKGIGEEYNTSFLRQHLIKGTVPHFTREEHRNDVVISDLIANKMQLKVGDKVYAYFFENSIRMRRFNIAGIYRTNMNQFDENVVIANLYTVNSLNKWRDDQSSGLEIFTDNFPHTGATYDKLLAITRDAIDSDGNTYSVYTIEELYAQIFDWLKLLDLNVWVILGLMACVACITMISGLLILILERSATIGILKAVGAGDKLVRHIFINYSAFIMTRGIVLGSIIGLGLAFLQQRYRIITLDATKYYVDHVPVMFHPALLGTVTVATILVCLLAMIGPSYMITKINPVKAIRFD